MTQKLFFLKMSIQNHVPDKHPQSEDITVHSLDNLLSCFCLMVCSHVFEVNFSLKYIQE
jgi:hypothetical protein